MRNGRAGDRRARSEFSGATQRVDNTKEVRAMGDHLAAMPGEAMHTLVDARRAANSDLDRYLKHFGIGFERVR